MPQNWKIDKISDRTMRVERTEVQVTAVSLDDLYAQRKDLQTRLDELNAIIKQAEVLTPEREAK